MINGLILDSEATVNEIIKRVTVAGGVVPALSSHTDDASHPRHSGTNIASVSKSSRKSSCGVISSSHSISEVPVRSAIIPQATQNVWVQRAAQRQKGNLAFS
ncbi:unnamed protein product [Enterobius vermicularis]|uniref:Uncharacterized protein n=1 Tax=Enterobius vermicularis TaxID=51028 RepID=A0A0N4UU32_ENTVE|nr:unnamed protein product [Enterobius vermicularis]